MRTFQTVYPLFEISINKAMMQINRSLEFDKHPQRTITLLETVREELNETLNNLVKKPSLHLANLGKTLNDLYTLDRTVETINVSIHFVPNPDLTRSSHLVFEMHNV